MVFTLSLFEACLYGNEAVLLNVKMVLAQCGLGQLEKDVE